MSAKEQAGHVQCLESVLVLLKLRNSWEVGGKVRSYELYPSEFYRSALVLAWWCSAWFFPAYNVFTDVVSHTIPCHKADVCIVLEENWSVLYLPLPGGSALSVWNLHGTCETQSLCCFCYRQLPGLQGQGRAEELCVRGCLVLSALNGLSRVNPSQQQSTRQPLAHSLPWQPHQGGNQKSWSEKLVAWGTVGLVGKPKALHATKRNKESIHCSFKQQFFSVWNSQGKVFSCILYCPLLLHLSKVLSFNTGKHITVKLKVKFLSGFREMELKLLSWLSY